MLPFGPLFSEVVRPTAKMTEKSAEKLIPVKYPARRMQLFSMLIPNLVGNTQRLECLGFHAVSILHFDSHSMPISRTRRRST